MASSYTKTASIPFNLSNLSTDILDSNISPTLIGISLTEELSNNLIVTFSMALSAGEETTLDGLISANNPVSTPNNSTMKDSVRVATTVNGTLSTDFEAGDTINGIVLAKNDRILIKNQSTASENGIYIVNNSGAPSRSSDLFTGYQARGIQIPVIAGTINSGTIWMCTNQDGSDIVGTNNLTFIRVSGNINGPASSTSTAIVKWNSTTGNLVANSGVLIDGSNNVTGIGNIGMSGDIIDVNSNILLGFTTTASATNYINIQNNVSGSNPIISNIGISTGRSIEYQTRGSDAPHIFSASAGAGSQTGILRLMDSDASNYMDLAPANIISSNFQLIFPNNVGTANQVLTTNGLNPASLSWTTPTGTGDVTGPGSSTDNAIARFDGTTGKIIQNSGIVISDTNSITGVDNISIGGDIFDVNNNRIIGLGEIASAVNYIVVTNSTTGNRPIISSQGTDTNISLGFLSKGTGNIEFRTGSTGVFTYSASDTSTPAELRLSDNDDTNYVALRAGGVISPNVTLTLPTTSGTSGQAIITDGTGVLSFAQPTINQISASAVGTTSTSSTTYGQIGGMILTTPPAGTYYVSFSSSGSINAGNQTGFYGLGTVATAVIAGTERNILITANPAANSVFGIHSQGIITVNGSQSITANFRVTGGSFTVDTRNLIAIRLS